jgi:cob(I)alamin adenosyltransferase
MPSNRPNAGLEEFDAIRVDFLEEAIDGMEGQLRPLGEFILPGGHMSAAAAHVSRAVCRRAERRVVALMEQTQPEQLSASWRQLLRYLNRLSDYLFVLARLCNHRAGVKEPPWKS